VTARPREHGRERPAHPWTSDMTRG
jgi:hypothetical protein